MSEVQTPLNWTDSRPDLAAIGQAILKLDPRAIETPPTGASSVPDIVVERMHGLTDWVAQVRSPARGWPSDVPPTPENLAPYALEEAYDVLEALKTAPFGRPGPSPSVDRRGGARTAPTIAPGPIAVHDLLSRLLWLVLGSAEPLVAWLGGVPARLAADPRREAVGTARVVVGLEVRSEAGTCYCDLTGDRPFASQTTPCTLSDLSATLHSEGIAGGQRPFAVGDLLDRLRRAIVSHARELAPLFEPTSVELFAPGGRWHSGQVRLYLQVEFISHDPVAENDECRSPLHELAIAPVSPEQIDTDRPLRQATLQRFSPLLRELGHSATTDPNPFDPAPDSPLCQVVAIASQLADCSENQLPGAFSVSKGQPIPLDDFVRRLFWQCLAGAYEMMQLLTGIQGRVLQPERSWQTGTLRLVGLLRIEAPGSSWEVDLATGEVVGSGDRPASGQDNRVAPKSAIDADECDWCRQPILTEVLLSRAIARVRARSLQMTVLERALFAGDPFPIHLHRPDRQHESSALELRFVLELLP
ncbi:hypothetical protein JJD41_07335 [Oxynema sp. CENA135]|uniref:hypothetical protein n=1 Tax=Oxynema sp. CENA135 TaxID=984206 RepID=UPI00190E2ED5|nr:hypothetical protein [Oxynema sp. CENA135]MBK4729680.1 hypothetical protein [Oxynema sp. CENA135]